MERDPRVVRVGLVLEMAGTVADLRSEVARECGVTITRVSITSNCCRRTCVLSCLWNLKHGYIDILTSN